MIILMFVNINFIKKYVLVFYSICILLLIYVLLFGNVINGSKSWINVLGVSIQPSEFVKICLLLCIDKYIKSKYGIIKCIILLLIPSILTFLQPDTGTVIFYLVIFFSIFVSLKINKKVYIGLLSIFLFFSMIFFHLYFYNSSIFINTFGTGFFYRIDRIINFVNNEGYQLNNALIGIGNGGLFGNFSKYIIYIPETLTDFMFANILMTLGFFGGIIVLFLFMYIDFLLVYEINKNSKYRSYVIGLFGVFLYQQIQHIFMNIGLLPITGITLPFLSSGGSSLISYFIMFGILFNIKKQDMFN